MEYKPDVVQKAKFEYFPLGQVFNKGLKTDEKQEGLLKRLKNIEDKTDKQMEENKGNQLGIKFIVYTVKEKLSQEAKNMLEKLNYQEKLINYQKLYLKRGGGGGGGGGNNVQYDFSDYKSLKEFFNFSIFQSNLLQKNYNRRG